MHTLIKQKQVINTFYKIISFMKSEYHNAILQQYIY